MLLQIQSLVENGILIFQMQFNPTYSVFGKEVKLPQVYDQYVVNPDYFLVFDASTKQVISEVRVCKGELVDGILSTSNSDIVDSVEYFCTVNSNIIQRITNDVKSIKVANVITF